MTSFVSPDSPRTFRSAAALNPVAQQDEQALDERYEGLVTELEENLRRCLDDGLCTPLDASQRAEALAAWQAVARPALIKQLDALIGPQLPVIAEACMAYNKVPWSDKPKDHNVCKGETVALVTRLGKPESPGRILMHYPGCEKHAKAAMASMGACETTVRRGRRLVRQFHSVIPLIDARREIRQQELADQAVLAGRHTRRWLRWRRR